MIAISSIRGFKCDLLMMKMQMLSRVRVVFGALNDPQYGIDLAICRLEQRENARPIQHVGFGSV